MKKSETFLNFSNGVLAVPNATKKFCDIPWTPHPAFEGVELKHLITAADTSGQFSYHLVKIAPNKSILNHIHEKQLETHEVIMGSGTCINAGQKSPYAPGTVSIIAAGIEHEVVAGADGLYLFAKFFPALS